LEATVEIRDEQGPGELEGWDSLGHANLIVALESNYGITIDLNEMMMIETIGDIQSLLAEKGVDWE
jgi:acyl carrier protein